MSGVIGHEQNLIAKIHHLRQHIALCPSSNESITLYSIDMVHPTRSTWPFKVPMSKLTVALLILAVTTSVTNSHVNETRITELVTIVTGVILSVTQKRTRADYCWFYTVQADPQPDDLLERIQQQPALRHVPRFTFKQRLPMFYYEFSNPYRSPILLIMDYRWVQTKPRMALSLKTGELKESYILVFINRSEHAYLASIKKMMRDIGITRVFYFNTDKNENFYENQFSKHRTYIDTFPTDVFPDQTRDLHGYRLRMSHWQSTMFSMVTFKRTSVGPIIDWVNITAQFINATYEVTLIRCTAYHDCFRNLVYAPDGRTYDMIIDPHPVRQSFVLQKAVRSMVPTEGALIAPRSRRLEIHELFVAPFKSEVWITFVLLLITCVLLINLFPKQFHNNLILLTLCSFERVALYRVKRLEKVVAISLIIFFFILLSAYESLFISLMTDRPRLRNPRTIQDLMNAGIKLELRVNQRDLDSMDERLQPLVVNVSNSKSDTLDGYSAYANSRYVLKSVMRHPENFDYESGESTYVMIDYSNWEGFRYHTCSFANPVVSKFRYTQSVLEESGILQKLVDHMEYIYFESSRQHQILVRRFQAAGVILGMYHVIPAWIILGLGWIISFVSLVVELGWSKMRKLCSGGKGKGKALIMYPQI